MDISTLRMDIKPGLHQWTLNCRLNAKYLDTLQIERSSLFRLSCYWVGKKSLVLQNEHMATGNSLHSSLLSMNGTRFPCCSSLLLFFPPFPAMHATFKGRIAATLLVLLAILIKPSVQILVYGIMHYLAF